MTDLRILQEFRELGDMVDLQGSDNALMEEVLDKIGQVRSVLLEASKGHMAEISYPRGIMILSEPNLQLLSDITVSTLVCELRYKRPYASFASLIGKQFAKRFLEVNTSSKDSLKIGHLGLMAFCKAFPGVVRITREYMRKSKPPVYCINRSSSLDKYISVVESNPKFIPLPMVCPPDKWTNVNTGGYLTTSQGYPTPFIRTFNRTDDESHPYLDMSLYYDAVNYIQATPWSIDPYQLSLVSRAIDSEWIVYKFPFGEVPPELPSYPLGDDGRKYSELSDTEKEVVQFWRAKKTKIEKDIQSIKSRKIATKSSVSIGRAFLDYEDIYFPHSLDYRGRVYPYPANLNPQGSDCTKSLIRYGKPETLDTPLSVRWAKIHIANLFGVDDVSYDDRVSWFDDNEQMIIDNANSPEFSIEWRESDKPWQFIQAAREWAKFRSDPSAPVRIMVAMDGSCSGIQHFSAMLRDAEGGKSVNLLPCDSPQDVYKDVAELVMNEILERDCSMATFWKDIFIPRDATKRPVMTLPYGLTKYSCGNYIIEWIEENGIDLQGWSLNDAGLWLNDIVWLCIRSHLTGASVIMDYLQKCAEVAAKEYHSIEWITPGGLCVSKQAYTQKKDKITVNMSSALTGKSRVQLILQTPTTKLNVSKLKSSIAPNFVHSYDAVHLCMVCVELEKRGIPGVSAIHDSIAVHPNYAQDLYSIIRECFVKLYRDRNVLQDLKDYMSFEYGIELPEVPEFSDSVLDFDLVLQSPYIFS